jgi:hypothetical protein
MGYVPSPQPEPAARAGLRADYRIFYDALEGQGDWVLIEPLGWVFRPDVNLVAWRPYELGYWSWNDWYGWVWVSEEPFGWATYHYGRWYYDSYQGWVWIPGREWGPAWVAWARNGDYLGWGPLPASDTQENSGYPQGTPPLNGWSFVNLGQLAGGDLRSRLVPEEQARELLAGARPIVRMAEREGEKVNLGPPVELVEKAAGVELPRTEVVNPLRAEQLPKPRARTLGAGTRGEGGPAAVTEAARRAGADAARRAAQVGSGLPPSRVELPLLPFGRGAPARPRPGRAAPAEFDSTAADSARQD